MSPVIILIAPQMGENIGALARLMSNFAMSELRIVTPRDGWPNPKAQAMAAGGVSIVDNAHIYADFPSAVADLNYIFATGSTIRRLPQPALTPPAAATQAFALQQAEQKVGIVFGRESTGMHNDEVALCQAMITIPCADFNPSFNLAQAAAIICYEFYRAAQQPPSLLTNQAKEDLPTHGQIMWLVDYLRDELSKRQFFPTPERAAAAQENIATLLHNANFTARDLNLLISIVKALIIIK